MNKRIGKANFATPEVAAQFAARCEAIGYAVYIAPHFMGRTQVQWYKD